MDEYLFHGSRASTASLAINAGLAVVKLVAGLSGNSYALVADAIESLGDIFSSGIVKAGVVIAGRPADDDHPYGHGKAEPLAALVVAGMLLASAVIIVVQSISEIVTPHHAPAPFTLAVLIVVVALKEGLFQWETRIARRIGSSVVAADAWHHRSDAITSAAAAIGITIAIIGGAGYEPADDWAALAACGVIVFNAARFARSAVHELMDTTPTTRLPIVAREAVDAVTDASAVEKVIIRKVGPKYYIDLHLEVPPETTVLRGHEISHAVKDAILARAPEVADVLVHIEPHGVEFR